MKRSAWVTAFCGISIAQQLPPGVYRPGPDKQAPQLIFREEPEYSDEARKAGLQGTVLLAAVIGEDGMARDIQVRQPLGLGLDERAVAAVSRWRFKAGVKDGQPVPVMQNIEVSFHQLTNPQAWHLAVATFTPPPGASRPQIARSSFPRPGSRIEGSVTVSFDIDEQGLPSNVHVDNASDPESADEVLALIREWRFLASLRNGAPVASRGTLDFERGDNGAPRAGRKRM